MSVHEGTWVHKDAQARRSTTGGGTVAANGMQRGCRRNAEGMREECVMVHEGCTRGAQGCRMLPERWEELCGEGTGMHERCTGGMRMTVREG